MDEEVQTLGDETMTEPLDPESTMPEPDYFSLPESFNQYMTAKVLLDHGGDRLITGWAS
jgi:hypothetical protein